MLEIKKGICLMATLSSWTSLLVTCIKTSSEEIATVICHITMFLLVTTTYSKEVHKIITELSFFSEMERYVVREDFFSLSLWQGQYLWGWAIDSMSLTAPRFWGSRFPVSQPLPVSAQQNLSLSATYSEGLAAPQIQHDGLQRTML